MSWAWSIWNWLGGGGTTQGDVYIWPLDCDIQQPMETDLDMPAMACSISQPVLSCRLSPQSLAGAIPAAMKGRIT